MFVLTQLVSIAFGFTMMEKQINGNSLQIIQTYVASAMTDGCITSFFMTYWFFLENLADRFCIINERLRLNLYLGATIIIV